MKGYLSQDSLKYIYAFCYENFWTFFSSKSLNEKRMKRKDILRGLDYYCTRTAGKLKYRSQMFQPINHRSPRLKVVSEKKIRAVDLKI